MTDIHTKTTRKTRGLYAVLERKARPVVVSFEPGDIITFKVYRGRIKFSLPIEAAFRVAVRVEVEARRNAKRRARS